NFAYFIRMYREIHRYVANNGLPFLVHIHIPVKAGWAGLYIKWRWNIPYIVTEHSSAYIPEIENGFYSRNAFFRFATRKILEGASVITSVSNWLIQHMESIFLLRKTTIIRNVVDTNLFYPSHQSTDKIRFIHVSMMRPLKNVEGILAALAILKQTHSNWELILVGPYHANLLQHAHELGLSDFIQWKGLCPYEEVASAMRSADALIHFSDYENLPCVISEALCAGLFVISSQVGGISELVSTSHGTLFQKGDVVALTEAMRNYLNNTSERAEQSTNEQFRAAFNYKRIGEDFDTLYRSIKL
ncbi:MAG: glycosyltransferase family 4 protein, partial [Chitinophagaceae bacterium]